MAFKWQKYEKIHKFLPRVVDKIPDGEYIATEKIHGVNFSIFVELDGKCTFYRRNGKINYSKENFYKSIILVPMIEEKCRLLLDKIQQPFILYGELCGPGVQKELFYSNELKFMPFDIKTQDCYLDYHTFKDLCKDLFELPREMFKTTREKLIWKCKEAEDLKNIEGVVIKGINCKERIIFKVKTYKFKESIYCQIIDKNDYLQNMFSNLTEQRLSNVLSKEKEIKNVTNKELKRLTKLFIKDAEEDVKMYSTVKEFNKRVYMSAFDKVNDYFVQLKKKNKEL